MAVRVLQLIPTLAFGGAEMDLVRLACGLDSRRYRVTVYPFLALGPLADRLEGIPLIHPPVRKAPYRSVRAEMLRRPRLRRKIWDVLNVLPFIYALAARVPANGFDIIHAILPSAYVLGGLLKCTNNRRAKLIMTRAGLNWHQDEEPIYRIAERWFLHRLVSRAIANSGAVAAELRAEGIAAHKIEVVHNGVDLPAWRSQMVAREDARRALGIAADALVLTCVGNLWAYKGHHDLIDAMALLQSQGRLPERWQLLIAGRDQDNRMQALVRRARERGIGDNVRLLGPRSDVPVLLSASDLHVSASHTESLPNNLLEAMCSELPIVATRVGGCGELVEDGINGFLTAPMAPEALAASIGRLVADRALRLEMGRQGYRKAAAEFGIEKNVESHASIYDAALRERRAEHDVPPSNDLSVPHPSIGGRRMSVQEYHQQKGRTGTAGILDERTT